MIVATVLLLGMGACDSIQGNGEDNLSASGVVEVTEISVSSEIAGRIAEVFVVEGDEVQVGDALFRVEGDVLDAQRDQAIAALEAAQANFEAAVVAKTAAAATIDVAEASVEAAKLQLELARTAARLSDLPNRIEAWDRDVPNEFDLPPWYFEHAERIEAAQAEVKTALNSLEVEEENFQAILEASGNADLEQIEQRLSEAQATFLVIEELKERDVANQDRKFLRDYVDSLYDAAEAELESAQKAYDSLLSDQSLDEVLEARARLAVAQERYTTALDVYDRLLTGEFSMQIQLAETVLHQAEAQLAQAKAAQLQAESQQIQAEKAVEQAQAALDLIDLQLDKLTILAAADGLIMTRTIEPGELAQPGVIAITIGQVEELRVTVYLPEDRYGQISVGDVAEVEVDSFPGETFKARVSRIADQAEYTPRNVQTEEDRRTTVYAVELIVDDSAGHLKPGMPADVTFSP
jgi:multidrug resistance efflux pump